MTPQPARRPALFALFPIALFFVAGVSLHAAEPAPAAPPLTVESLQPVLAQIAEATALGDNQSLRSLVLAQNRLPAGEGFATYHLALTRACLDLALFPRALQHFRAAGSPPEFAWLAGIAYCYQRDWPRADRLILGYKRERANAHLPAYYYLTALRAYLQWTDLPAGDPHAKELLREADDATRGYESTETQQRPGFDPRFLRLRVLVAAATGRRGDLVDAVIARSRVFPRHLPFARAALASFVITDTTAGKQYLATLRLPPDEAAGWLRAFDARPPDGPLFIYHDKATAAAALPAEPAFDESRFILLRAPLGRSLEYVDRPRRADGSFDLSPEVITRFRHEYRTDVFVSAAIDFARLAAASFSLRTDAEDALLLWDLLGLGTERPSAALATLELDLARRANDHARSVRLILAQAPAHAADPRWLGGHGRVMAEHAPLPAALSYLRQLEKLEPESLSVLLALAGLALRPDAQQEMNLYLKDISRPPNPNGPASLLGKLAVTDDLLTSPGTRLALYQRVFSQAPQKIIPPSPHWAAYRALLRHDEDMSDLLDDEPGRTPPAKDAFTDVVERCHSAAPNHPVVAEQYALLLARRAQTGFNRTTHAAFLSALAAADQAGAPLAELTRFQTAFAAHAAKNAATSRAKAALAASDTTARLARERAAQDQDIAAARARASAIRSLGQQLDRRRDHLIGLPAAILSLRELLRGNYDPANKADFRAKIAALEREIENLCRQCKGFGVKEDGKSVSRCSGCSGSGQRSPTGGGASAGFESLTAPFTLDAPPAKSPQSKSGAR